MTRPSTGSAGWVATPGLPTVAVYGLTYDAAGRSLYAATHGRSVWKLPVPASAAIAAVHVPEPSTYGAASAVQVSVSGAGATPTGTVTLTENATTLGNATLDTAGKASFTLPATLAVGTHTLTVTYNGDGTYDATSSTVTAMVTQAASTTTASAPKKVKPKKRFDVTATVTAAGTTATGTVEVYDGPKLVGTATLANGTAKVTVTKGLRKRGTHALSVRYLGSASVSPSQTTVRVKVTKKHRHRRHHR